MAASRCSLLALLVARAEAVPSPSSISAAPEVVAAAAAAGDDIRCGFKPGESKERCVCHAKTDAKDSEMGDALNWLCGRPALDGCKDINAGGKNFDPNTIRDHANWAYEHWYLTDESYTSCFFGSGAYLSDSVDKNPPLGHYEMTTDGKLSYPTAANTKGATDSIAPGASKSWVSTGFTGNWVGTNAVFSIWLTGTVPDCRAHGEVSYDFNGNGTWDRIEVYSDSSDSLRVLPESEAYTNAVGTDDSTNGEYASMTPSGKVKVTIFNDKDSKGGIQVVVATGEAPSFITVPYHNGPEIRPPPPPKPEPIADCPTWYEITQRPKSGTTGLHWTNVKSAPYSAKGDGNFDDWGPINMALTQGRNMWQEGALQPRVAYFPSGHYRIRDTLPSYMYTHMIGNHECRPTIVLESGSTAHFAIAAAQNFDGPGVDNFYHQIQNINVQVGNKDAMGLHWKVAQGTNLRNMTFFMDGADTAIFIENGGGGFIGDVTIQGGKTGLDIGGQQWMIRNLRVDGCSVMAVNLRWNWLFTFMGTHMSNMNVGFGGGDDDNPSIHGGVGDSLVGSLVLIDTTFENVKTGITEKYPEMTAVVMDRVTADAGCDWIMKGPHSSIKGDQHVKLYRQGYGYEAGVEQFPFLRDIPNIDDKHGPSKTSMPPIRPDTPMENRGVPQWQMIPTADVVNVMEKGCKGDGVADDSTCLQSALTSATKAVFLPSGTYLVSQTINIPAGKMLLGEGWSEIQAKAGSSMFTNALTPKPVLSLAAGAGRTVLSNLMLTVGGDLPGAIMLDWKAADVSIFDVHWRLIHKAHTSIQAVTSAGGYMENSWVWTADHDINGGHGGDILDVEVPHGLVSTSTNPTWFVGVAIEHHSLANFEFTNAAHQTMLMAQTETPYWQDPPSSWMFNIEHSAGIAIYGAVGENWYHGTQVHLNNIASCTDCTVFVMATKSEKTREYSDPDSYAMNGDHKIESRKDTGTCSTYVVDTYK